MNTREALALARRIRREAPDYSVVAYTPVGADGVELAVGYSTGEPIAILHEPGEWLRHREAILQGRHPQEELTTVPTG
jgi:hypothetical protein